MLTPLLRASKRASVWRPIQWMRLAHSNAHGKQLVAQGPNELLLYYTNVFLPVRIYNRRVQQFVEHNFYSDVSEAVAASFPADLGVTILETVPRSVEGAMFVKIACADRDAAAEIAAEGFRRRWLVLPHRVAGFRVQGVPSLTHTPPPLSNIALVSPALDPTALDELMHSFGRITEIKPGRVVFAKPRFAMAARQCLNRSVFRSQELAVVLERVPTLLTRFRSWFSGHTRFSVPLLLFVLAGLAASVFDPIREYSISSTIQDSSVFSWLSKRLKHISWTPPSAAWLGFGPGSDDESGNHDEVLNRLAKSAEQLKTYLDESEPTFTVVYGPHGSGKNRIADLVVPKASNLVLHIDCDKLSGGSQGDERKLAALAKMLGYWPAFPWANRIARLVDLELKALTGQPAGISKTTEEQSQAMLDKTTSAIYHLALRDKRDQKQSEEDFLEMNAASRPVVVIRGYASGDRLSDQLVAWTTDLILRNIARVVIITRDASFDRTLAAALPNRPPRVVSVYDASLQEAHEFVRSRLDLSRATSPEAKEAFSIFARLDPSFLRPLGGRFTDLQMFARRLSNGEMPEDALHNQLAQAALTVSLQYLRAKNVAWTPEQAWVIISLISAANDNDTAGWVSVPGVVAQTPAFKNADTQTILEALEAQEMVSAQSAGGRIVGIKASRPLFGAAFKEIASDALTAAEMNIRVYQQQIKLETEQISKLEAELSVLNSAPAKSREVADRQQYLCAKLGTSQATIVNLEGLVKSQRQLLVEAGAKEILQVKESV